MTDLHHLRPDNPNYPPAVRHRFGDRAPGVIAALGNVSILEAKTLALFCSGKCPGNLILQAYDLARALRDAGRTVIGGFHSPIEKECLSLLLRGTQPVIICPARSLEGMRLPAAWRAPLAARRLLLLSPFENKARRATADLAQARNELVAALADEIVIIHAAEGSRLAAFARAIRSWPKPLLTLPTPANDPLLQLGAQPLNLDTLARH